jgi:hypothetical protein
MSPKKAVGRCDEVQIVRAVICDAGVWSSGQKSQQGSSVLVFLDRVGWWRNPRIACAVVPTSRKHETWGTPGWTMPAEKKTA